MSTILDNSYGNVDPAYTSEYTKLVCNGCSGKGWVTVITEAKVCPVCLGSGQKVKSAARKAATPWMGEPFTKTLNESYFNQCFPQ